MLWVAVSTGRAQHFGDAFQSHGARGFNQHHIAGPGKMLICLRGEVYFVDLDDALEAPGPSRGGDLASASADGKQLVEARTGRAASDFEVGGAGAFALFG